MSLCCAPLHSPAARSPLYSHLSTTLLGLTTVRACEMESVSLAYFHAYQDEQTRGWSVYLMSARWLAVRVDCIIGVFIAVLALSSIPLASSECGNTCAVHVYTMQRKLQSPTRTLGPIISYVCMCHYVYRRCVHAHSDFPSELSTVQHANAHNISLIADSTKSFSLMTPH